MSLQRQFWIWIALFLATVLLLWVLRGVLLPFVVGMGLAYLLDPVADLLERWKLNRFFATAISMTVVLLLFIGAVLLVVPLFLEQLFGLVQRLPGYVAALQGYFNEWQPAVFNFLGENLGEDAYSQLESSLSDVLGSGLSILGTFTGQVMQSGLTFINLLGLLIVTPVVAFYLLLDWDRMTKAIDDLLPRRHRDEIREVLDDINKSMAGVIRGQGTVVILLAIFYGTSLSLVGLNFGLAIGIAAGLLSFVPYVGFLVGFVLSTGVAIVQFWPDGLMVGLVVGIFLVGQFLEGNVLYPKLVGSSIGVHPVWLMFSLFAVGILFGTVGLLLAVPFVAIARVLINFAVRKYQQSSMFLGDEDSPDAAKSVAENE